MIASAEASAPGRLGRTAVTLVLLAAAGVLTGGLFTALTSDRPEKLGWDFRVAYLPAAEAVVHHAPLYPPPGSSFDPRMVYAYPPQLAVVLTPLTLLPVDAAAVLAVLGSIAAVLGALALVGVRDIRCYAAVLVWASSWNAFEMANASALLALLLALVWRYRSALLQLAAVLGAIISLKLFLWPVLVWAAVRRGLLAAVLAVAFGVMLTFVAWDAIGFDGLRSYPGLLRVIAEQQSYSLHEVGESAGLSTSAAQLVAFATGGALVLWTAVAGLRGDARRSFLLAIAAGLALSSVVWIHYLVLLAVPLGLYRPRFSPLWLLPVLLWVSPRGSIGDGIQPLVPALVVGLMVGVLVAGRRRETSAVEAPT